MKPTGALKERYEAELLRELDAVDELTAALKAETKERKEEIQEHQGAIIRLRNLLSGKRSEQIEIPGAEIPAVKPRDLLITLTTSDGKTVTATSTQMRAALDKVNRSRASKAGIEWADVEIPERADDEIGTVAGGEYHITRQDIGGFNAKWVPASGRDKILANDVPFVEAKKACEDHHVERQADGLLEANGSGEMNTKALKGAAVTRIR